MGTCYGDSGKGENGAVKNKYDGAKESKREGKWGGGVDNDNWHWELFFVGSPLYHLEDDGELTVVGIDSRAVQECADEIHPTVFVEVSWFIDWIEKTIKDNPWDEDFGELTVSPFHITAVIVFALQISLSWICTVLCNVLYYLYMSGCAIRFPNLPSSFLSMQKFCLRTLWVRVRMKLSTNMSHAFIFSLLTEKTL